MAIRGSSVRLNGRQRVDTLHQIKCICMYPFETDTRQTSNGKRSLSGLQGTWMFKQGVRTNIWATSLGNELLARAILSHLPPAHKSTARRTAGTSLSICSTFNSAWHREYTRDKILCWRRSQLRDQPALFFSR